jgi:hypothetical protein
VKILLFRDHALINALSFRGGGLMTMKASLLDNQLITVQSLSLRDDEPEMLSNRDDKLKMSLP